MNVNEANHLIGNHVMEWTYQEEGTENPQLVWCENDHPLIDISDFNPLTNPRDTQLVSDKMNEKGYFLTTKQMYLHDKMMTEAVFHHPINGDIFGTTDESFEVAVCLSALKSVYIQVKSLSIKTSMTRLEKTRHHYRKQTLIDNYSRVLATEEFQMRAENGEKTAEEFAGQYLFYYKEHALNKFVEECQELDSDFFREILSLLR